MLIKANLISSEISTINIILSHYVKVKQQQSQTCCILTIQHSIGQI